MVDWRKIPKIDGHIHLTPKDVIDANIDYDVRFIVNGSIDDYEKIMKTYTQEELLKIANKLFTDNREYEGTDDIDKNPYAAGRHDGILEMLTKLGIDCEEEPQSY